MNNIWIFPNTRVTDDKVSSEMSFFDDVFKMNTLYNATKETLKLKMNW
jgi:hypothetical protein